MKKQTEFQVSSEFEKNVQKAITLLLSSDHSASDELILELFQNNGIGQFDSTEILVFLPIAFIRQLFDHIKWHATYVEFYDENNQVEKKFADSVSFQIICKETERYFQHLPVSRDVMKIAGRSAEFNILNDLLLRNPDAKAEDIILSKTFIVR